jgi:DNA excision repair protein ERCC-2
VFVCLCHDNDNKTDYPGIVILADSRYNRADKRSKLPPWIVQFIRESSLNLSTDLTMDQMKFLKVAGQLIDQQALQTILFDKDQVVGLAQQFQHL